MAEAQPPTGEAKAPTTPKHKGLFGHEEVPSVNFGDLSTQINNVSVRLRVLEERYNGLRRKTQVTDQNMLNDNKEVNRSIKVFNSDLLELKRELSDLKDKARLIVKELKTCASNESVAYLQKYVDLWSPVSFVTRNEVERIVEDKIQEMLMTKNV